MRLAPYALIGAVVCAVGFAALDKDRTPRASAAVPAPPPLNTEGDLANTQELPPNHPAMGAATHGGGAPTHAGGSQGLTPPSEEAADLVWKKPSAWKDAPNPSSMRIATYRVPGASGAEDADVSISRAGGSLDMNIERWVGQFQGAEKETRVARVVRGVNVTIVEIHGAYVGGGMGGSGSAPKAGWAMLTAVVEGGGTPYFMKMVGPDATVKAARPQFDELVGSIAPAQ